MLIVGPLLVAGPSELMLLTEVMLYTVPLVLHPLSAELALPSHLGSRIPMFLYIVLPGHLVS